MSPKNTPMTDLSPDNKIINGLWISPDGRPLSNLERLCIYSFCAHGHDFRLWTYGGFPNVPQDTAPGKVEVCDGNEILPADKIFRRKGELSHFSDWFRWILLRRFGGWYMDMDTICLRPIDFKDEIVFFSDWGGTAVNAFLKIPKSHFIAEAMVDACANPDKIMPWDTSRRRRRKLGRKLQFWKSSHSSQNFGESGGPEGFGLAVSHYGMNASAKSSMLVRAVDPFGSSCLIDGELHRMGILQPIMKNAYCIHLCNRYFRCEGWDKDGNYHPDSPFEILKRRYLPELAGR